MVQRRSGGAHAGWQVTRLNGEAPPRDPSLTQAGQQPERFNWRTLPADSAGYASRRSGFWPLSRPLRKDLTSPTLSIQAASIVIRGQFNPAIISPGWLLAQGLLGPKEALDVRSQAILNQLSQFHVSWLQCQVTEDQFSLSTDEPAEFERLRDVAAGTFETLSHTPLNALGINRSFHFQIPSWEDWHAVGDRLVPKAVWKEVLHLSGTASVTVQGNRQDEYAGRVLITVQPSRVVSAGVFVSVNDHYVLETVEAQPRSRAEARSMDHPTVVEPSAERIPIALKILREMFRESIDRSETVAFKVIQEPKGS